MTRSRYFFSQDEAEQYLTDRGFSRITFPSRWSWISNDAVFADVRFNSKGFFINFAI